MNTIKVTVTEEQAHTIRKALIMYAQNNAANEEYEQAYMFMLHLIQKFEV